MSACRLPNLLVLGFTRCGTTSLHNYLGAHPNVFMSKRKELSYFNYDAFYKVNERDYRKHFAKRTEEVLGESTPMYAERVLFGKNGRPYISPTDSPVRRIALTLRNVKVIVSLRNPMERYISIYEKNFAQGKRNIDASIFRQIENDLRAPEYSLLFKCRYQQHLDEVFTILGNDNVRLVVLEEWSKDTDETMRSLFEWISVENDKWYGTQGEVHNTALRYKKLLMRLRSLMAKRRSLRLQEPLKYDRAAVKAILYDNLRDDITYIEQRLGRTLPRWHL